MTGNKITAWIAYQVISWSKENAIERIQNVYNIAVQDNASSASNSISFSKEFVSNKTKIVSNTVKMADATNARIIIINLQIMSAFQKNLAVFIKKENVHYVNIPSISTNRLRNVELTDALKHMEVDAYHVDSHLSHSIQVFVKSLTVQMSKTMHVLDVHLAIISNKGFTALKMILVV